MVTPSALSPTTNKVEEVRIHTTVSRDGRIVALIAVSPEDESGVYAKAFQDIIAAIRIAD